MAVHNVNGSNHPGKHGGYVGRNMVKPLVTSHDFRHQLCRPETPGFQRTPWDQGKSFAWLKGKRFQAGNGCDLPGTGIEDGRTIP